MKQRRGEKWAINEMSNWLAHPMEFGRPPVECEIVYKKKIPWGEEEQNAFLVRYKMDDGYEMIGFTGPFTWSFVGTTSEEGRRLGVLIEDIYELELPEKLRWQRVMNVYIGWYLYFRSGDDKPNKIKHDKYLMSEAKIAEQLTKYFKKEDLTHYPDGLDELEAGLSEAQIEELSKSFWEDCFSLKCLRVRGSTRLANQMLYACLVEMSFDGSLNGKIANQRVIKEQYYVLFATNGWGKTIIEAIQMPVERNFYTELLLCHWIGNKYGAFVMIDRWGNFAGLEDNGLKAGYTWPELEAKRKKYLEKNNQEKTTKKKQPRKNNQEKTTKKKQSSKNNQVKN